MIARIQESTTSGSSGSRVKGLGIRRLGQLPDVVFVVSGSMMLGYSWFRV